MHLNSPLVNDCDIEGRFWPQAASAAATLMLIASAFFLLIEAAKWWHAPGYAPAILALLLSIVILKGELWPTLREVHSQKDPWLDARVSVEKPEWLDVHMSAEGDEVLELPTIEVHGRIFVTGDFTSEEERRAFAGKVAKAMKPFWY